MAFSQHTFGAPIYVYINNALDGTPTDQAGFPAMTLKHHHHHIHAVYVAIPHVQVERVLALVDCVTKCSREAG